MAVTINKTQRPPISINHVRAECEHIVNLLNEKGYKTPKITIDGDLHGRMTVNVFCYTTSWELINETWGFTTDERIASYFHEAVTQLKRWAEDLPREDEKRRLMAYNALARAIDNVKEFGVDTLDDDAREYAEKLLKSVSKNLLTYNTSSEV